MTQLVRLKPHNPKRGHTTRSYTLRGMKIEESRGWYTVEDDVAEYLKTVQSDSNNPDSPLAFDVMSQEDAVRLEEAQRKAAQARAQANDPIQAANPRQLGARALKPLSSNDPAAVNTHYGRPHSENRERTHLARPDETEESRDAFALGNLPGAPKRPSSSASSGAEFALEVTDLSGQVDKKGTYAGNQLPFDDGSPLEAEDPGVSRRNPDPRNLGERARGAYDDTPFVDGSRDAVAHGDMTHDPRNPDPRNIGRRSLGAYDDTPFVDGSRDAVVAPFSPEQTADDQARVQTLPATQERPGTGTRVAGQGSVPPPSRGASSTVPGAPRTRSRSR